MTIFFSCKHSYIDNVETTEAVTKITGNNMFVGIDILSKCFMRYASATIMGADDNVYLMIRSA